MRDLTELLAAGATMAQAGELPEMVDHLLYSLVTEDASKAGCLCAAFIEGKREVLIQQAAAPPGLNVWLQEDVVFWSFDCLGRADDVPAPHGYGVQSLIDYLNAQRVPA